MRFANLHGRSILVVADADGLDRAVDIERASDGTLSSDPAVYVDLANHPRLAEVATGVAAGEWPVLDLALLGAPVPRPPKGLGVGLNYRTHAIESGREFPTEPHLFGKTNNCVAGPFDDVIAPAGRHEIDFEAEVVIAFGRTCTRATETDAWSYLAGVTCGQDISDRGEQFRPPIKQFTIAKSYDTFGPTGPFLVTPDEFDDRDALELTGVVSGEVMQHANTSDLIFSIPALVVWLTRFMTFGPGDLVWTGTPGGVGEARTPQRFLVDGDLIETTVSGVGTMRNRVVVR
ncbi:MAG: fumarylacetoacetate hydrolase family protein [Acidimicrobiales bacterium]|nr:fumarylacetoacetate hydrolase family protein [Acidimicrobiales bacterium]MCB9392392.1 fumarylacetoacetate hydrolase family protein [Acidimicrobiaceae bacterium]